MVHEEAHVREALWGDLRNVTLVPDGWVTSRFDNVILTGWFSQNLLRVYHIFVYQEVQESPPLGLDGLAHASS